MTNESIADILRTHGFRATPQRIAVYKYLLTHRTHPSADEIYKALSPDNPAFSKTTVYNTLQSLVDAGLAITVSIASGETRFDGFVLLHGHFRCKECGNITDFELDDLNVSGLEGYDVNQRDVYFTGVCPACKSSLR